VREELLDAHDLLAVGAELGEHVRDALVEGELALLEQQPRRRRGDRLAARKDDVEAVVHRVSEGAQRGEASVPRHGELAGRQHAVAHLALRALEQLLELSGVDADGLGGHRGVGSAHAAMLPQRRMRSQ
jgi:hypothetical protein